MFSSALKTLTIGAVLCGGCLQLSAIVVQADTQVATIRDIVVTGGDHDLGIEITATAPITPRIQIVTRPDRLIVDFPEVLPGAGLNKLLINRGKLRDIRVALLSTNPRITRVVMDLLMPLHYRFSPSRNTLVVNLGDEAEPASAPILAVTKLPVETRAAETTAVVATLPPALSFPEPSRARWILPILTMATIFAMLVIAMVSHIQNKRMRRGL